MILVVHATIRRPFVGRHGGGDVAGQFDQSNPALTPDDDAETPIKVKSLITREFYVRLRARQPNS